MDLHNVLHRHKHRPLGQTRTRLVRRLSRTWRTVRTRLARFLSSAYRATRTHTERLAGSTYRLVRTTGARLAKKIPAKKLARVLREPARILAGAALGMLYGPMTAIVLGIVGTLLPGIVKSYAGLAEAGAHVLLGAVVVTPIVALTLGLVALGIGGIVGAINAAAEGGVALGLEWSFIAGLGSAIGLGIRFADLRIALLGLVGGGLIGGSVGFLTWLGCTNRHPQPLDAERAIGYTVGLVLIAAFVPVIIG